MTTNSNDLDNLTEIQVDRSIQSNYLNKTTKKRTSSTTSSFKQEIFGITITKLTQRFSYEVNGNVVTNTKSCRTSVVNYNFVVAIDANTSHWVSGSNGVCETTWSGYIAYKGFGIRMDKIQYLRVNGRSSIVERWLVNA